MSIQGNYLYNILMKIAVELNISNIYITNLDLKLPWKDLKNWKLYSKKMVLWQQVQPQ